MNTKIKYALIATLVMIGAFVLPIVAAQQPNEYRAFVYSERPIPYWGQEGSIVPTEVLVTYVPIYPSATYTLSPGTVYVNIDYSQPTSIDTTIAQAVKQDGLTQGYEVTKVYLPSYSMKVV